MNKKSLIFCLILFLGAFISLTQSLTNHGSLYGTDSWSQNLISDSITAQSYLDQNSFNNDKVIEYSMFPGYPILISSLSLLSGLSTITIIAFIIPVIFTILWLLFGNLILLKLFEEKESSLVYLGLYVIAISAPFIDRILRSSYDSLGIVFFAFGVYLLYQLVFNKEAYKWAILFVLFVIELSFIHHLSAWLILMVFLGVILYATKQRIKNTTFYIAIFGLSFFVFFLKLIFFNDSLFELISQYFHGQINTYLWTLIVFLLLLIFCIILLLLKNKISDLLNKLNKICLSISVSGLVFLSILSLFSIIIYYLTDPFVSVSDNLNQFILLAYFLIVIFSFLYYISKNGLDILVFSFGGLFLSFLIGIVIPFPLIPVRHMSYLSLFVLSSLPLFFKEIFKKSKKTFILILLAYLYLSLSLALPTLKGVNDFQLNENEISLLSHTEGTVLSDTFMNAWAAGLVNDNTVWYKDGLFFYSQDLEQNRRELSSLDWDYIVTRSEWIEESKTSDEYLTNLMIGHDKIYSSSGDSLYSRN